MFQQIHLQDSLFPRHGAHIEMLDARDGQVLLRLIGGKGGFLLDAADESILTQPPGKAGFILADLAFDGGNRCINGGEHIGSALRGAEPGSCTMDGELCFISVLLHRENNQGFCIILEVAGKLHHFLLGVLVYLLRKLDFLFTKLKLHMRQLLSMYRFSRGTYTIPRFWHTGKGSGFRFVLLL